MSFKIRNKETNKIYPKIYTTEAMAKRGIRAKAGLEHSTWDPEIIDHLTRHYEIIPVDPKESISYKIKNTLTGYVHTKRYNDEKGARYAIMAQARQQAYDDARELDICGKEYENAVTSQERNLANKNYHKWIAERAELLAKEWIIETITI